MIINMLNRIQTARRARRVTLSILATGALIGLAACAAQPTGSTLPTASAQATTIAAAPHPSATAIAATAAAPTQAATQASATTAATQAATVQATAASCASPAALTPAETEGPYFKAGSPERASLLNTGTQGTKLVLTGYVLTADCKPVANALLDFWQADASGSYDNSGYTLRGHQYTDASGHFTLTTVVPGLYPGRTEHIHVKVQAPNGPVLTTQLFFPGVAGNASDNIYNSKLLINIQKSADGLQGTFNFVINTK